MPETQCLGLYQKSYRLIVTVVMLRPVFHF